jgi:hypothetical protein
MKNVIRILSIISLMLVITLTLASCGGRGGRSGTAPDEPDEASAAYLSKDTEGNTYALSFPTSAARAVMPGLDSLFELKYNGNPTKGGTVTNVLLGGGYTLTFTGTSTTLSVTIKDGFLKDIVGTIIGTDGSTLKTISTKIDLTPTGNSSIKSISGTYKFADAMAPATVTFNGNSFTMTVDAFGNANLRVTVRGTYTISQGIITATIMSVQAPSGLGSGSIKQGDTNTLYILSATQICDDKGKLFTKQ